MCVWTFRENSTVALSGAHSQGVSALNEPGTLAAIAEVIGTWLDGNIDNLRMLGRGTLDFTELHDRSRGL